MNLVRLAPGVIVACALVACGGGKGASDSSASSAQASSAGAAAAPNGSGSGATSSGSSAKTNPARVEGVGPKCAQECAAIRAEQAKQYCGTDKKTYAGCDWTCGLTPQGVGVFPGACGPDGAPAAGGPKRPADGDRICDWMRVGTDWIAVECSDDIKAIPAGKGAAPLAGVAGAHERATARRPDGDVDHRARYGAIKSQGAAGTCTAFATTALLEGAVRAATGERLVLSEMHLWARYHESSTPAAAAAAEHGGIALLAEADGAGMSYDPDLATDWEAGGQAPDGDVVKRLDAKGLFEVASVESIVPPEDEEVPTAEQLLAALAQGSDVLVGMYTSDAWNNPKDGYIEDYDLSGKGGHAVALVGYKKVSDVTYFIIRNSWGSGWADGGYAYLSVKSLRDNLKYAWTIEARAPASATAPNCPDGQAAGLLGTCRKVCDDGGLADESGACKGPATRCPDGEVADASGSCVTACKTGEDSGTGFKVSCKDKGCAWTVEDGAMGCTNGPCDKYCAAPSCDVETRKNELGETIWTCGTK